MKPFLQFGDPSDVQARKALTRPEFPSSLSDPQMEERAMMGKLWGPTTQGLMRTMGIIIIGGIAASCAAIVTSGGSGMPLACRDLGVRAMTLERDLQECFTNVDTNTLYVFSAIWKQWYQGLNEEVRRRALPLSEPSVPRPHFRPALLAELGQRPLTTVCQQSEAQVGRSTNAPEIEQLVKACARSLDDRTLVLLSELWGDVSALAEDQLGARGR